MTADISLTKVVKLDVDGFGNRCASCGGVVSKSKENAVYCKTIDAQGRVSAATVRHLPECPA